jgi:TRAP-type mannitol/chloroaromatic compound transport system permease small subunit
MWVLEGFVNAINAVNDWIAEKLAYLLFGFFLLILLQVILRYVFNAPTVWAGELAQMLFGAYAVLTGGYILRMGGHVNVDIIYSRLSEKSKAGIDIFTSILFFLFCVMLLIYGGSMAMDSVARLETSGSAWDPPVYPFRLTLPLAAFLLLVQGLAKLIVDICTLLGVPIKVSEARKIAAKEESL